MRLLTKICMPVVALGAAVVAAPALAQNEAAPSGNAAAATPAQPAQDANSAAIPAQPAQDQTAMNSQSTSNANASSSSPAANAQVAMNTTGNANDLSSIPDTKQKYNRAKRNTDNRSEDETTKQLNQKESSLNGASGNPQ